jgi:hypothetical protein
MFILALFAIVKLCNQSRFLKTDEWIKKLLYIFTSIVTFGWTWKYEHFHRGLIPKENQDGLGLGDLIVNSYKNIH